MGIKEILSAIERCKFDENVIKVCFDKEKSTVLINYIEEIRTENKKIKEDMSKLRESTDKDNKILLSQQEHEHSKQEDRDKEIVRLYEEVIKQSNRARAFEEALVLLYKQYEFKMMNK